MDVIRELCSFKGRRAGTDSERRAANWLAGSLRDAGRRVEIEPTYVHPQYAVIQAAHCALAFAGSLVAVASPPAGFAMVLVAATSMYLDLNYRMYLLRRLFFRRASQNVVARGKNPDAPARVVLVAHIDTAKTGAIFNPKQAQRAAALSRSLQLPIGPFRIVFWSMALLLPILGARMAGLDSNAVSLLQLPSTLILLVAIFALVDIELSDVVPGANDNASGVAATLSLAEELDGNALQNLDVWVLLTGGEECLQEGMRSFIRAHRRDLDAATTFFLCLDTLGRGRVRYEAGGGWVVTYTMDKRLVELCDAIAEADGEDENRFGARRLFHGYASDAMPARLRGYPATTISCLTDVGVVPDQHTPDDIPENVDDAALERAHDFTLELIRQLDRDVGRRTATTGEQTDDPADATPGRARKVLRPRRRNARRSPASG
jgi:hypothetical protein